MSKAIEQKKTRIESLDWLRGLMALSILFYHFSDSTTTNSNPLNSTNVLGRLGIYGVSSFYVLSGLSIAIVYNDYIKNASSSINFFIRRIFRIWPLLWIVCFFTIVFNSLVIKTSHYSFTTIFLNLTTLFGFIKPSAYIPVGAWSIGNEMVYYSLTPIIIYLFNKKKLYGNILFFIFLFVGAAFSSILLNPNKSLASQWGTYINPFNNFFIYLMGISIYYNFKELKVNYYLSILLLIIAISLFSFFPFKGDLINIVTGNGRFFFILIIFILVTLFYRIELHLPKFLSQCFSKLGAATYGVYLIHPIIFHYTEYFFRKSLHSNPILFFIPMTIVTIAISIISYYYFELQIMKISKQITYDKIISKLKTIKISNI